MPAVVLTHGNPFPRNTRSKSTSEIDSKADKKKSFTRKLSVVGEDENDVFYPVADAKRHKKDAISKRQHKFSIPDVNYNVKDNVFKETKREPKKHLKKSEIPRPVRLRIASTKERETIISPVPLPSGVECIDLVFDNGMFEYWKEFIHYLKQKEGEFIFSANKIIGDDHSLKENRKILMNWVLELTLHFKVSQETLYHSVRLIDTVLAKRSVAADQLQLVAIVCFFIAAKLEEYYPPSVTSLLEVTEDSYTAEALYKMEIRILKLFDGVVYGPEPMIFLNRYIRASFKEDDETFKQVCQMFVDIFIPSLNFAEIPISQKSACAVLAARILSFEEKEPLSIWTPTLQHYTGYAEKDLVKLAKTLIIKLLKIAKATENSQKTDMNGFVKKFQSKSRHNSILRRIVSNRKELQKKLASFLEEYEI